MTLHTGLVLLWVKQTNNTITTYLRRRYTKHSRRRSESGEEGVSLALELQQLQGHRVAEDAELSERQR